MVSGQLSLPPEATGDEDRKAPPAANWRKRRNAVPMPAEEAARQGSIATLAFQILGKETAIAFLNTEHSGLGGRPITIATQSKAGEAIVRMELARLAPALSAHTTLNSRPDGG